MSVYKDQKEAFESGHMAGQIALIEFLLETYPDMSIGQKAFLQKVLDKAYNTASNILEQPAEDIALSVAEILEKRLTK